MTSGVVMLTIEICNWKKLQHYKDRCPPWIKLHRSIIEDPENFARWHLTSADAVKFLMELWLLASRTLDGCLRVDSEALAFQLHRGDTEVSKLLEELELRGWCYLDASNTLARRKHDASSETETETEVYSPPKGRTNEIPFDSFWSIYPRKENKKKAETAWKRMTIKDQEAVMKDLPGYSAQVDGKEKRFILLPTSYLNGRRWEDEREREKPRQPGMFGYKGEEIRRFLDANHRTPKSKAEMDEFMDIPF